MKQTQIFWELQLQTWICFFGGLGGGGKPSRMDGIFRWIFPWFPSLSGEVVCYFHQIHALLTCWKWNKIGPLADCEWEFVQLNHGVWKRMEKGYVGTTPCPVTVTFFHWLFQLLFENPYKPSFVTVILGGGLDLSGICISWAEKPNEVVNLTRRCFWCLFLLYDNLELPPNWHTLHASSDNFNCW